VISPVVGLRGEGRGQPGEELSERKKFDYVGESKLRRKRIHSVA